MEAKRKKERDTEEAFNLRERSKERNPRWRVQRKIQEWEDMGRSRDDRAIPMTHMDIFGAKGRERIDMVDVNLLRARCKGIGEGISVSTLLDQSRHRERQAHHAQLAAAAKATLGLASCSSEPSLVPKNQGIASQQASSLPKMPMGTNYEQRSQMVQCRRLAVELESMVHKFNTIRGKYPQAVPESIETHLELLQNLHREVSVDNRA